MALVTTLNSNSSETSNQSYFYQYRLHHLYNSALCPMFSVDNIDQVRFINKHNRRISIPHSSPTSYHYWRDFRKQSLDIQEEGYNGTDSSNSENEPEFKPVTEEDDSDRFYSTKTSYKSPMKDYTLSSPPSGFKPICVQFLARHGSRTLTGHSYDTQTLKNWQVAQERNMLTHLGEQLKEDIERFMKENNQIG